MQLALASQASAPALEQMVPADSFGFEATPGAAEIAGAGVSVDRQVAVVDRRRPGCRCRRRWSCGNSRRHRRRPCSPARRRLRTGRPGRSDARSRRRARAAARSEQATPCPPAPAAPPPAPATPPPAPAAPPPAPAAPPPPPAPAAPPPRHPAPAAPPPAPATPACPPPVRPLPPPVPGEPPPPAPARPPEPVTPPAPALPAASPPVPPSAARDRRCRIDDGRAERRRAVAARRSFARSRCGENARGRAYSRFQPAPPL